jgi:glycosyltransferase involved in cell wall biosynthesis
MAVSSAPRALVTTSTFPRWEGDATAGFVRDLAELATPAWELTVLAPHHPGAPLEERMGSLDVVRFPYWIPRSQQQLCYGGGILPNARASTLAKAQLPALVLAELIAMRGLMQRRRFDLVHAHFLVPQGIVASMLMRRSSTPLVVSVHGSDLFALEGHAARAMQRKVVEHATMVTVNSDATADELRRRAPASAGKIATLPMGFDERLFHPGAEERASSSQPPQLLYVGRLSAQKGLRVLLDALPRVVARVKDATLLVVGEGPMLAELRAHAAAIGLADRVVFAGGLGRESIARLHRSSAVLVMPSLSGASGAEGQGLVAIEAMASGCPVVVTRSGGLGALIGSDERGLLVTPGDASGLADAVVATLEQHESARRRAQAARAFVLAHSTWTALRPALLDLYAEARARWA